MTPDLRMVALAEVGRALEALAPHLHSADDQATLARLKADVARLSRPAEQPPIGLRSFDPTRFQRLIDLAGPAMADTLLTHLADDLARCRAMAMAADGGPEGKHDWATLRESSHILISLAGSVGALSLQNLAETLNTAAHGQDGTTTQALIPAVVCELDALIALVRATPTPKGGAA